MLVLGLNYGGHDPAAALLADLDLLILVEQERISRNKRARHESPAEAVNKCLEAAQVSLDDIDAIAVGWDHSKLMGADLTSELFDIDKALPPQFQTLRKRPAVYRVPHHLAHAASAYWFSGFSKAAILVMDGQGETESATLAVADATQLQVLKTLPIPVSLGHFYRAAAQYAGLERNGLHAEGKLMGLAAYGKPIQPMPLRVSERGLELTPELVPPPIPDARKLLRQSLLQWWTHNNYPFTPGDGTEVMAYADFAASVQCTLEQAVLRLAQEVKRLTNAENLVVAGGVFLNCTANRILAESGLFKDIFFMPVACPHSLYHA